VKVVQKYERVFCVSVHVLVFSVPKFNERNSYAVLYLENYWAYFSRRTVIMIDAVEVMLDIKLKFDGR